MSVRTEVEAVPSGEIVTVTIKVKDTQPGDQDAQGTTTLTFDPNDEHTFVSVSSGGTPDHDTSMLSFKWTEIFAPGDEKTYWVKVQCVSANSTATANALAVLKRKTGSDPDSDSTPVTCG